MTINLSWWLKPSPNSNFTFHVPLEKTNTTMIILRFFQLAIVIDDLGRFTFEQLWISVASLNCQRVKHIYIYINT